MMPEKNSPISWTTDKIDWRPKILDDRDWPNSASICCWKSCCCADYEASVVRPTSMFGPRADYYVGPARGSSRAAGPVPALFGISYAARGSTPVGGATLIGNRIVTTVPEFSTVAGTMNPPSCRTKIAT